MIRTLIAFLLLLCALFTVLPIPARQVWYLGIAVPEFPWVWIAAGLLMLCRSLADRRRRTLNALLCTAAIILFCRPVVGAYRLGGELDQRLQRAFGDDVKVLPGPHRDVPFSAARMIGGIGAAKMPYDSFRYTGPEQGNLSLNYYPPSLPGVRPCLLVVHGGSWKSGSNAELPDVNSYFARAGYGVASINYRLAPQHKSPAPQEDVRAAIAYLRAHAAALRIDPERFVLLGRSAGGQIVLTAAYSMADPGIRGVVSFYGPTDMFWAYNEPHNTLVLDPKKVMPAFFGGTPGEVPEQYTAGSPMHYVNSGTVPTLLVHGALDKHVHIVESERLDSQLAAAGVPHLLLRIPWATHGCEYSLNGPSGQLAVYSAERFLAAVTK
jgi:acetyl esterase/lipase